MEKNHEHFFSASLNHFFFSSVMMMMMVVHGLSHGHPSNQAGRLSALWDYTENPTQGVEVDDHNLNMVSNSLSGGDEVVYNDQVGKMEDDLIEGGLPGQPSRSNFKQYAGYVSVDEPKGRSLFYYFVEASHNPSSKPLVLWLNGGPGCSSVGIGAMVEIGPFGVKPDGKTLYTRKHAWNKVANVLFVESPAGVGFSYSNTTSDYNFSGDKRTAQDAYTFLLNWFRRFPEYKDRDFYITGESYAGFYIPELTDTIIKGNKEANPSSMIQLKGIMIGNGVMNLETDRRGRYDYTWSHALISDETHRGLIENCLTSSGPKCEEIRERISDEMGEIDLYNIYAPQCLNSSQLWKQSKCRRDYDPCEEDYVQTYLNLPQVQEALHANRTKLPYKWEACSVVLTAWKDRPSTVFPIYRRLIASGGLRILLYSGDVDAVVPVSSTRYSIEALNLKVVKAWHPWLNAIGEVSGYEVVYNGLTFATVRGAGHQVPQFKPQRALALFKMFLAGH
ncbi:hypothetical protein RHMOL_Rhmol11G0247000 [Rhododendron molle]|uniref:Uncharacterized protein n=1 Tax=Rhododendron molle TaxID=49168 RepID=A0ACC0LWZ0_RHOML|nr:hypothetical protein RHMOL_Rhmol11G0247000 [Rhododendron molle]